MEIISKTYLSLSKSVCQSCGTINSINAPSVYNFNNNVYGLNSCDNNFYLQFDNTTHEHYDEDYHLTTLKRGEYCKFCKGTYARATQGLEDHDFTEHIDGQIGNNRFYIAETCDDCGYETSEYVTAKSVVTSYYGIEDGDAHTLTVSNLSDSGVRTSIRYGTSADSCTKSSAPNYTQAGYYTVYYEIDYSYAGEVMTENGVSYVHLVTEDENNNGPIIVLPEVHEHEFHYLETVKSSCDELGYDRFQCNGCGEIGKRNYTPAHGHDYDEIIIKEATCKQGGLVLTLCADCGDFYQTTTQVGAHKYKSVNHNPTCKNIGYTEYTCEVCEDNYINNIQPIIAHSYLRVTKEPTCLDKGYTTSTCTMCGLNTVSDYTEPFGHDWDEGTTVTNSTCVSEGVTKYSCLNCEEEMIKATSENGHTPGADATCTESQICQICETVLELPLGHDYSEEKTDATCTAMGFSTFTCDCGDSYISNYTDRLDHDYGEEVTEPTCIEHGYTTYSCLDCEAEYISDYQEKLPHNYKSSVTESTCNAVGYTTYTCEDCQDTYKGAYTEIKKHSYSKTVISPDCTEMGYTLFKCNDCENIYTADYLKPLGHTPSEWIIDVPATIESSGSKHIECMVCGETLQSADLAQLIDKDNSDEDGKAIIGDYTIILTDENGKPIFNSELTIDVNDNVSIKLTNGRLLDYAKPTTITAFYTESQQPKENLKIYIEDVNGNKTIGFTNADGQLIVPNNKTNTNDDNGTIGKENNDTKETFVITVTDKTNVVIPDCDIYIGESNNVVVDLPEGVKPTREEPVIVTITDHNGKSKADVTVIALGTSDYIEKGTTDMYGKVTIPITDEGYTDNDGKVNVEQINVIVNDETEVIPNAFVKHNEDGSINVILPENKSISYDNRITVTVLDSMGNPVKDRSITVSDISEKIYTAATDKNGRITVPPENTDITDNEGEAIVSGYNVLITDETKTIPNAYIEIVEGKINVKLPDGVVFDYTNRITATVTDAEEKPVKDMSVTFTDSEDKSESNLTDENGKASVPPINMDYTDVNGYSEVDGYIVTVVNENEAIEKAFVTHNVEVKNEDETVKTAENITVLLPAGNVFDYDNRITVTVRNKADKTSVKDMNVIITETPIKAEDATEEPVAKTLTDKTDANGKAVFPPLNEDITDNEGNSGIEETKPGEGENPEDVKTEYKVVLNDTKGVITNALVKIVDGKVTVTLPETHTLTTSNQTTVTVTDNEDKAVQGVSVTINDKTASNSGITDVNGKVTLPVITSSGGSGSVSYSSGGGGSYISTTVKITDKDGKSVSVSKSVTSTKATLTLPTSKNLLEDDNYYTITVTSGSKAKKDYTVVLKDRKGNEVTGTTDENGIIILPGEEHKAYIFGYNDGSFRPDNDMTRAEAAAIFARLIAEEKSETVSGKATFSDVPSTDWAYGYIGYLEKYDIIKGYSDGTFRPDDNVTRAEFVTMAVRYYALFNEVKKSDYTVNYTDLTKSYWAYSDIAYAKYIGWLNGYADGTFKGDNNITRSEVVTVTNHATKRTPDEDYINKNVSVLNKFTDLKNNSHWAYYDIMEAANTHLGVANKDAENWVK